MSGSRRTLLLVPALAALLVASCGEASGAEAGMAVESETALVQLVEREVMADMAEKVVEVPVERIVVKEVPVETIVEVERVVEKIVTQSAAPTAATATAASAAQPRSSRSSVPAVERRIIRTASIGIVVADVAESVRVLRGFVSAIPQAFMAHTDIRGDDPYAVSSLTVRVPVDRFDETIERIRAHGSEVVAEDVSGRDVTAEFTDLESRLRNAQATERQLLEIMGRAETVEDTLAVQRELGAVREQVEVYQGQLNVLASQTSLSTITIYLHPAPDLRIERRLPDRYAMHQSVTFPITVANDGTVELREIEIHDRLSPDMVFEQASPPGVYDPATHRVAWSIDRLAAGEAREVWLHARLEGDGETMELTASASTPSLVRDADQDQAEAMLPFFVDLSVTKHGETAVPLGREITYGLSFVNLGNGDARDVRLVERLPEGMTFVRADGGGSYDAGMRAVVWSFPEILPGGARDLSYVARVDQAAGRLQTETSISSAGEDRADVDNNVVTFLTRFPRNSPSVMSGARAQPPATASAPCRRSDAGWPTPPSRSASSWPRSRPFSGRWGLASGESAAASDADPTPNSLLTPVPPRWGRFANRPRPYCSSPAGRLSLLCRKPVRVVTSPPASRPADSRGRRTTAPGCRAHTVECA